MTGSKAKFTVYMRRSIRNLISFIASNKLWAYLGSSNYSPLRTINVKTLYIFIMEYIWRFQQLDKIYGNQDKEVLKYRKRLIHSRHFIVK